MDRRVCSQVIAFGGAYHFTDLYSVLCTSLTRDSCNTKVLFNHFDRDSWIVVGCTLDFDDCSTLKSVELANFVVQKLGAMPVVFSDCQGPYYKLARSNVQHVEHH